MLLSFLLFISVTDCKQYNTTFSLVYKRGSWYLFKDSMVPFFALVALCLWYLLSVGGTRGTQDRQNNSTIEMAVLHLKTFPVIVGNGVSFLIFRHSTMCGLIFFFIIAFFFWIANISQTGGKRYGINSTVDTVARRTQTVLTTAGQHGIRRMLIVQ